MSGARTSKRLLVSDSWRKSHVTELAKAGSVPFDGVTLKAQVHQRAHGSHGLRPLAQLITAQAEAQSSGEAFEQRG